MKTVQLRNIDTEALRTLFERSVNVTNSLEFTITPDTISSFSQNEAESLCKDWSSSSKGIFEHDNDFEKLDFFFIYGKEFKDKILPYFNKGLVDVTYKEETGLVTSMIFKVDKLNFKVTPSDKRFVKDLTEEDKKRRMTDEGAVSTFDIETAIISEINKLADISEFSEKRVDYIEFVGADGTLSAKNDAFEKTIGQYDGEDFAVKINRKNLPLVDKEPHTVKFCRDSNNVEKFVFISKNSEIQSATSILLMTTIDVDDEEFSMGDDDGFVF